MTLEWALSELLNNQGALKKLQQEIDSTIGLQRKVEETDTKGLPYLQAVVKETLRLHPPGPLLVPHESTEDCTVMGYHIPAGTQLLIHAWKIHRDPRWWTRPLEFEPERFVGPHGGPAEVDLWGRHFHLIPFGAGRRACPGTALALHILHLTIARLLHAFEWKLPAGAAAVDMREGPGLSSPKAVPLVVERAPREFLALYS